MGVELLRCAADYGLRIADRAGILKRIGLGSGPVVLMYHGILPRNSSAIGLEAVGRETFIRQMRYLKQHFRIVHPSDLERQFQPVNGKPAVVLTFDDGFGSNATIAWPILEELQMPAALFISTRHLESGRYLWFVHARAVFALWPGDQVRLAKQTWKLASKSGRDRAFRDFLSEARTFSIDEIYRDLLQYPVEGFVPPDIIDQELRGMTHAEVEAISKSSLMVIGAHTCTHPYLTTCPERHLESEITGAKAELERICGRPVTMFAYPSGDYDAAVGSALKRAGFTLAFAVSQHTHLSDDRMMIPRVGIYRPGLGILAMRSYGLASPGSRRRPAPAFETSPIVSPATLESQEPLNHAENS